jgi:hypothetical protein
LAWPSSFAASARWTITWSVHQYQIPRIGAPRKMPVHGKSGWLDGFIMWKKPAGTCASRPLIPPTRPRPMNISVRAPTMSTTVCITSV